ncbi:MAG: STAS domain-containing protein [Acidobacteriota bacterium]
MKITKRTEEDVHIFRLAGKLTIGEGDVVLRDVIKDALDRGATKLLIDLQGVRTMDSSGLGELIRCKATASSHEATVKLLHVENKVQAVLEMTRLIGVFDTFDDEIEAVASFRG